MELHPMQAAASINCHGFQGAGCCWDMWHPIISHSSCQVILGSLHDFSSIMLKNVLCEMRRMWPSVILLENEPCSTLLTVAVVMAAVRVPLIITNWEQKLKFTAPRPLLRHLHTNPSLEYIHHRIGWGWSPTLSVVRWQCPSQKIVAWWTPIT